MYKIKSYRYSASNLNTSVIFNLNALWVHFMGNWGTISEDYTIYGCSKFMEIIPT